jgi:hypothetical protein
MNSTRELSNAVLLKNAGGSAYSAGRLVACAFERSERVDCVVPSVDKAAVGLKARPDPGLELS